VTHVLSLVSHAARDVGLLEALDGVTFDESDDDAARGCRAWTAQRFPTTSRTPAPPAGRLRRVGRTPPPPTDRHHRRRDRPRRDLRVDRHLVVPEVRGGRSALTSPTTATTASAPATPGPDRGRHHPSYNSVLYSGMRSVIGPVLGGVRSGGCDGSGIDERPPPGRQGHHRLSTMDQSLILYVLVSSARSSS
jgi:hypothetical protein